MWRTSLLHKVVGKFWYKCTDRVLQASKFSSFTLCICINKIYFETIYLLLFNSSKKTKQYDQQCSLKLRVTTWEHFFPPLKLFLPSLTCSNFKVSSSDVYMFQIFKETRKKQWRLHVSVKNSIFPQIPLNPVGIIPQDSGVNKRTIPHSVIN